MKEMPSARSFAIRVRSIGRGAVEGNSSRQASIGGQSLPHGVALAMANATPWGKLCPPMLACLDELPSTAPLPTLRTRMANERALGISFIYAAQTWRQRAAIFGEQEARALFGLTNVAV